MRSKRFKITLLVISISTLFYHVFNLIDLWSEIPYQIAIHFTGATPDNWGSKYFLLIMPIVSVFIWLLVGLLVKNPEKMNYINLTEENKEIQFSRTEKVMLLIQNLVFISLIPANEAMLRNAAVMESSLTSIIAIILMAICIISLMYLLFWAATLKY